MVQNWRLKEMARNLNPESFFGTVVIKKIRDKDGVEQEFEIPSFSGKDMKLFIGLNNPNDEKQQALAMHRILKKILQHNMPGITDEQIDNIDFRVIGQLLTAAEESMGIKDELDDRLKELQKDAKSAPKDVQEG